MLKILANIFLALTCAGFLGACAETAPTPQESPDVQDIQPGDKSVIDAPRPVQSGSSIEERPL